jgi:DNA (cytosine-5)-methyltransferase 1
MAGFAPMHFYELETHSCRTLRYNTESSGPTLEGPVYQADVREMDWLSIKRPVRLVAAAAPCQPFSLAGKHLAERDGRNLFPEVLRAIRELRPVVVLLENVRGLLRNAFQPYFEYVLRQLECPSIKPKPHELWHKHNERIRRHQCSVAYEPEYHVMWRLLDAADFGVPQIRQRVFIIATRKHMPLYRFPAPSHSQSALLRIQTSGEYWDRHGIPKPRALPGKGDALGPEDGRRPWVTVRDALSGLSEPPTDQREAWANHWLIPGARLYAGHIGSILDWPSKAIKAGVHGVPGGENTLVTDDGDVRYYTLREAARLQTFPDTHYFEGARMHVTRQIGNAVPCRLVAAVARPLHDLANL